MGSLRLRECSVKMGTGPDLYGHARMNRRAVERRESKEPRPLRRSGSKDLGRLSGLHFIGLGKVLGYFMNPFAVAQGHRRPSKATSSHTASQNASRGANLICQFDHEVEFRAGDLKVVPERLVRGDHERPKDRVFFITQGFGSFFSTCNFAYNMEGPSEECAIFVSFDDLQISW